MKIESFEKFIFHKDRQLFVFEKFISTVDRKINDIIWESLGVSPYVDSMVRKLVDEIMIVVVLQNIEKYQHRCRGKLQWEFQDVHRMPVNLWKLLIIDTHIWGDVCHPYEQ